MGESWARKTSGRSACTAGGPISGKSISITKTTGVTPRVGTVGLETQQIYDINKGGNTKCKIKGVPGGKECARRKKRRDPKKGPLERTKKWDKKESTEHGVWQGGVWVLGGKRTSKKRIRKANWGMDGDAEHTTPRAKRAPDATSWMRRGRQNRGV